MNNLIIAFSPSQSVIAILGMFSSIITFILISKLFPKIVNSSFQFSGNYYLVGLVFSLCSTFICLNMEVKIPEFEPYYVEEMEPEATIVIPRTVREKPKTKLPPPPKDVKIELPKLAPVIKPVEVLDEVITKETDITDLADDKEHYNVDSMIVSAKEDIPEIIREEVEPEIHRFVDQMPRFPGCENIEGDKEAKRQCAEQNLLGFIYKNLKYPAIARENNISGTVTLQFVVDTDGSVIDIKSPRGLPGGCTDAAIKAVEKMNKMDEKWTPGKQNGRAVKVLFTLPIKFELK